MDLFAKRLKATRTEQNVSARELAEAVGVNKATIHHYEKAEFKSIKTPVLLAIAKYLDVSPDYLTGETDEKHTAKEAEALLSSITDDEKMLLELFRRVPVESQQMVLEMIRIALKRGQ
jgi:transcriptional regulator with XRE-family HTH domain